MRMILALLLALSAPALAAEKFTVKMKGGETAAITLREEKETARVVLEIPGREPSVSEILGEEFQEFDAGGKPVLFAAQDLDGDGTPEIFVRTTLPPQSGQLFAFHLTFEGLRPVKFGSEDQLEVSHGGLAALQKDAITFEEFSGGKHPSRRTVRFDGQAFAPLLH